MKLRYCLGLEDGSTNHVITPGLDASRLPFQIPSCGYFLANYTYFTEREGLDSHLLLVCVEGNGLVELSGNTCCLRPGDVLAFDCLKHQHYRPESDRWVFFWMHFRGTAAPEYVRRMHPEMAQPVKVRSMDTLSGLFASLFQLMQDKPVQVDLEISLLATRILTEIILSGDQSRAAMRNPSHTQDVECAVSFIERNWRDKISAGDILAPAHISPFHFTRLFKEQTGRSPYEYLVQHRLDMAVRDLLESDLSVSDIAIRNGFGDATQFIRRFRRHYGTTPAVFRRHVH